MHSAGFHVQDPAVSSQRFVPMPLKFIEKAIGQHEVSLGADQGLFKITIADQDSTCLASDAPRPTCYVTSPELVRDALSGPLLGPAELSKCFVVGMHNHGVTCYVNACIQMLQASVHAMKLLISTQYRGLLAKDQLSRAVFSTLDDLRDAARSSHRSSGASYGTMYPKQIINQLPRFHMSPYSMGDAYELLLLILDNISTAEIRVARADEYVPPNRDTTAIDQLFGQLQRTTISCSTCKKDTISYSLTRSLQLPLNTSLYGAMKKYFRGSEVDGYRCEKCGQKTKISMVQNICNTPTIALFCISRWDSYGMKNSQPCACPLELDMSRGLSRDVVEPLAPKHSKQKKHGKQRGSLASMLANPDKHIGAPSTVTHRLVAMINHHGSTMNSGHYTAFVRDVTSGVWYLVDDSIVTRASEAEVSAGTDAYVLLYEKADISVRGAAVAHEVIASVHEDEEILSSLPSSAQQNTKKTSTVAASSIVEGNNPVDTPPRRSSKMCTDPSSLEKVLYPNKVETWTGEDLPPEILTAKAPNGELALVSDYLHRGPDEMDAEIDRGRRRKTKAIREENHRQHTLEARKKKHERTQQWKKRIASRTIVNIFKRIRKQ
ncbi:Ubiquitin carboxyl-terminal hydrolase [Giardia duodenalis]|uniref:Ubiquitin carboxyl-terminal hydrolase n=1 Tax=Giardia intestinalis TaxID=5741 RepID=V6TL62_GIAIN|nr:Ubiquitin carboxyl-terminal hydrolase [Giardia intestinalis]